MKEWKIIVLLSSYTSFRFVRSFQPDPVTISSLRQKYNNLDIDRIKERNKSKAGRIGIKSIRYNIDTRVHDISSRSFDTHGFYSFSRDITRLHPYTRDENGDDWKVLRRRIEDYVCKKIAEKSKQQSVAGEEGKQDQAVFLFPQRVCCA